jgi:hypothetical protein
MNRIPHLTTKEVSMQSQILRPSFGSLGALVIVLVAVAALALALLASYRPAATVRSPAAPPAAPTAVQVTPAADANPDANLPICKRNGGPTC